MKSKIIIFGLIFITWFLSGLPVSAQDPEEEALQMKAREIYDLIMCPLCAGQTIGQSRSETSAQMRELVLKKLRQGETKEEILQYFESRYGERILAMPGKKGFNLVLWISPFILMAFAATVIYFLVRRWSKRGQETPGAHFNEDQLSEYEERLEKELEQFDQGLQE